VAAYTTADLEDAILRRCFAPTGQLTFTTAEILALSNEVLDTYLLPDILSVREEYYVVSVDESITANQAAYDIPVRAIGMHLRDLWVVDGDSITANFPRVEPETVANGGSGTPEGFYLKNNSIILVPYPATTSKTLRKFFSLRPGKHIETAAGAVIASINTGTNTVTVSSIPTAWATGDTFDLIRKDGAQEPRAIDLTSTLVTGSSITLPSLPDGLAVGDYVALAGETPLPHLPPEYRTVLAQGTAAEILEAMNQPGAAKARERFDKMRETATKLITPRVQGEDRTILPLNWF
jgi:hypothetical protein